MHDNLHYNKSLLPFASALRHSMTKAEACLWKYVLRAKKMKGYPFRRQRPVSKYIADFLCKELKLIIEVDGYTHTVTEVFEKDAKRQRDLESLGFYVLRFRDEDVLKNVGGVKQQIEKVIEEIKSKCPPP